MFPKTIKMMVNCEVSSPQEYYYSFSNFSYL